MHETYMNFLFLSIIEGVAVKVNSSSEIQSLKILTTWYSHLLCTCGPVRILLFLNHFSHSLVNLPHSHVEMYWFLKWCCVCVYMHVLMCTCASLYASHVHKHTCTLTSPVLPDFHSCPYSQYAVNVLKIFLLAWEEAVIRYVLVIHYPWFLTSTF